MKKNIKLSTLDYPSSNNYSVLGLLYNNTIYHSITISYENNEAKWKFNISRNFNEVDEIINYKRQLILVDDPEYATSCDTFATAISYNIRAKLYQEGEIPISNLPYTKNQRFDVVGTVVLRRPSEYGQYYSSFDPYSTSTGELTFETIEEIKTEDEIREKLSCNVNYMLSPDETNMKIEGMKGIIINKKRNDLPKIDMLINMQVKKDCITATAIRFK